MIEEITERMMLKKNAGQNPATEKPGTHAPAIMIMKALMTSRNSPNVKRVNGMVRMTMSGFRKMFRKLRANATSRAVQKELTWIPGSRYPAIMTAMEVTRSFRKYGTAIRLRY
jgi:hypothetical protein